MMTIYVNSCNIWGCLHMITHAHPHSSWKKGHSSLHSIKDLYYFPIFCGKMPLSKLWKRVFSRCWILCFLNPLLQALVECLHSAPKLLWCNKLLIFHSIWQNAIKLSYKVKIANKVRHSYNNLLHKFGNNNNYTTGR